MAPARPLDATTEEEARTPVEAGGARAQVPAHPPTHTHRLGVQGGRGRGAEGLTRSMNVRNFQLPP